MTDAKVLAQLKLRKLKLRMEWEFAFRFNSRHITEAQRFDKLVSLSSHRNTYKVLINDGKGKDAS